MEKNREPKIDICIYGCKIYDAVVSERERVAVVKHLCFLMNETGIIGYTH